MTDEAINFIPPNDPYALFGKWFHMAEEKEINDPGAMCLATVSAEGKPSARMVLLKEVSEEGFKFHTNSHSRKGDELSHNPSAALCFHWKTLRKQIRVEGVISAVSTEESDNYFNTRSRQSQIGAWASQQSDVLKNYQELQDAYAHYEEKFKDEENIPRPEHWIGYRLKPDMFEFWQDGAHRLHQRHLYTPDGNGDWTIKMLNP